MVFKTIEWGVIFNSFKDRSMVSLLYSSDKCAYFGIDNCPNKDQCNNVLNPIEKSYHFEKYKPRWCEYLNENICKFREN